MPFEVRWFLKGNLPENVKSWADRLGDPMVGSRTDYYLVVPGSDHLGVKGRGREGTKESKIEVKWRTRTLTPVDFLPNVTGVLEDWLKLSWGAVTTYLSPEEDIQNAIDQGPEGPWIAVPKRRQQWTLGHAGSKEWGLATGYVDRALTLEITELSIRGEPWWTLGFDVLLDEGDDVVEVVKAGTSWLLKDFDGPPLTGDDSYGYPRFVNRVTER